MNNEENKNILIHTRKMALYLQMKGFMLVGIRNDKKDNSNKRKIFEFIDSPAIKRAMSNKIEYENFVKNIYNKNTL